MIFLEEALTSWVLDDYPYSVITKEKISEQISIFYLTKKYKEERIQQIRKSHASSKDYITNIQRLMRSGVISSLGNSGPYDIYAKDQLSNIYIIKGKPEYSTEEILCTVYPYGYISNINAMAWHDITDKIPKVIRFTACSTSTWREKALSDIKIDFNDYIDFADPNHFASKYPKSMVIDNKEFIVISEKDYVEPIKVKNSPLRVSSIGKTFIDMLRNPKECGGEEHVIEVYIEHGKKYSPLIIKALKDHGRKIDIARAGFILQKVVGVDHPQLIEWQKESKGIRGSSKILFPGKPFSPIFDEDWSLSLNNELAQKYGN